MINEGLAFNVGRNPSGADNLLPLGSGQTGHDLGQLGRTALGGRRAGERADPNAGGTGHRRRAGACQAAPATPPPTAAASGWPKDRPQAEQEAAWKFIKWLMEPEQQAEWFAGTGYLPVRNSSYDLPAAQEVMAKYPGFRVVKDIFLASPATPATLGPLLGPFEPVRETIRHALEESCLQDKDPKGSAGRRGEGSKPDHRGVQPARPVGAIWGKRGRGGGLDHERQCY